MGFISDLIKGIFKGIKLSIVFAWRRITGIVKTINKVNKLYNYTKDIRNITESRRKSHIDRNNEIF